MAYSTINKHTDQFNTVTYTGNGSTQSITGVGFRPDFTWAKVRADNNNTNENGHMLIDAVRGVTKYLQSNNTEAEATNSYTITSFDSDGFSLGNKAEINSNTNTYVAWNWKAANSSGSSNSDGSITSTVSANTTAGFSIVTYTGTGSAASFGHGLSTPDVVLIKDRTDNGNEWYFHTTAIDGSEDYLRLQSTASKNDASSGYCIGASAFNLGGGGTWVNVSSKNYVAYCFKEVKGFSKFGSYKGNGNANGTTIYTGFKPAFVLIKGSVSGDGNAAQSWELYDNKRIGHNPNNYTLVPNTTAVDSDGDRIDILSTGFKIRINSDGVNDNNSTYFYMAFGQSLVGSNNIPCTAR